MKEKNFLILSQQGFVLVLSLMMLVVLTFVGFIAIHSTVIEKNVATSDRVHRQTFAYADGGTELAQHVSFYNGICSTVQKPGFTSTTIGDFITIADATFFDQVIDFDAYSTFYNYVLSNTDTAAFSYYPGGDTSKVNLPHTNFYTTSKTVTNEGSGLQMIAGYEGAGGSAVSGTSRQLTIASLHTGEQDSQSLVQVRWRLNNQVLTNASKYDCDY